MKIKEEVIYLFLFLIALALRLPFIYSYNLPLSGDAIDYNGLGLLILNEHKYYTPGAFSRPPAYPFFISMIYWIFGYGIRTVRIVQALFSSGMCLCIYWLGKKLFNRTIALIAAFFSVFYLLFIKSPLFILTECLFTFVLFLLIVYIYKSKERFSYFHAIVIGLLLATLNLIKGIMLPFLPFLLITLWITKYYSFIGVKELAKRMAVVVLVFILPLSIWTYRNYKVYHAFVPVSTQGGFAFYDSYFPRDGKIFGVSARDENVRYALSLNSQIKMSDYLFRKTVEFIRANPFKVLKLELLKFLYFWCPFDWELMDVAKGIYNFQYVFMLPFAIFGMMLLSRNLTKYAPLYIIVVYTLFMSLLFYGSPRVRMPVEPYLIIFFAAGIFKFFRMFNNTSALWVISISYACINFIMYLNSDLVKYFFRNALIHVGLW